MTKKNIFFFILYYLGIIASFASFIFNLNLLICIINIIIFLNVLFVVSYYLYNLFKNPIFWETSAIFISFCIYLIVNWLIIHVLIDGWNFGSTLWNDYCLEGIKQEFVKLKVYIYNIKDIFTKREYVISFFDNYITNIYIIFIYYITLRIILFFFFFLSIFRKTLLEYLKYLYNLTYYYFFSSYFFYVFILKKIISLLISIWLIMFSNKIYLDTFISYIFSLNPLIFIISVIILLSVFVVSYYLYNLLKNTIFWEIFKIFIILFIVLIIGWFVIFSIDLFIKKDVALTLSPRLLNPIVPDPKPVNPNAANPNPINSNPVNPNAINSNPINIERLLNPIVQNPNPNPVNLEKNLEHLQEKLVAEKKAYNIQKNAFDIKVAQLADYFNAAVSHIEFTRTNTLIYIKTSGSFPSESTWLKTMGNKERRLQEEINSLIIKANEIEALDARIHSLTKTNFNNTEYQNLIVYLSEYKGSRWYLINRDNKILIGITKDDLKNMDFSKPFFEKK